MKAPNYERQIEDSGAVQVRQQPRDIANVTYNANKIAEQGNAALAKGINDFNVMIGKMEDDKENALLSQKLADAAEQKNKLLYNSENGLLYAENEAASGMSGRVKDGIKQIDENITKQLSPRLKIKYAQAVANANVGINSTAIRTEAKALKDFRIKESGRLAGTIVAQLVQNPDMPMEELMDGVTRVTTGVYGSNGVEQDMKNAHRVMADDIIPKAVLSLAQKDYKQAQTFFENYKSQLDDGQRKDLEDKMNKIIRPQIAQDTAAQLYKDCDGNLEKMLTSVENKYTGEEENYLKSAVKSYYSERKNFEDIRAGETIDKTMELMHTSNYKATMGYVQQHKEELGSKYWNIVDSVQRFFEVGRFAPKSAGGASGRMSPGERLALYSEAKSRLERGDYSGPNGGKKFLADFGGKGLLFSDDLKKLYHLHFDDSGNKSGSYWKISNYVTKVKGQYNIADNIDEDIAFSEEVAAALKDAEKEAKKKGRAFTHKDEVNVVDSMVADVVVGKDKNKLEKAIEAITPFTFKPDVPVKSKRYQVNNAVRTREAMLYTDKDGNSYAVEVQKDGSVKGWRPDTEIKEKKKKKKK